MKKKWHQRSITVFKLLIQ